MSGGSNELARCVYTRLRENGCIAGRAILNEVQYCLNAMLKHGGFSAYRMVAGSNHVDLSLCQANDTDLDFAKNTSIATQLSPRRKLRIMAQEATWKK